MPPDSQSAAAKGRASTHLGWGPAPGILSAAARGRSRSPAATWTASGAHASHLAPGVAQTRLCAARPCHSMGSAAAPRVQEDGEHFRALLTASGESTEVHLHETMPRCTAGGMWCALPCVAPRRTPSPHMKLHQSLWNELTLPSQRFPDGQDGLLLLQGHSTTSRGLAPR